MIDLDGPVVSFVRQPEYGADRAMADVYLDGRYVGYLSIADPAKMDDVLDGLVDGTIVLAPNDKDLM